MHAYKGRESMRTGWVQEHMHTFAYGPTYLDLQRRPAILEAERGPMHSLVEQKCDTGAVVRSACESEGRMSPSPA
eukprot:461434-Pelagomonas_calceolata.AAC.16